MCENSILQLPKQLAYIRTLEVCALTLQQYPLEPIYLFKQTLHVLSQTFTLDADKVTYPPSSVCSEGTESIQRFLCSGEPPLILLNVWLAWWYHLYRGSFHSYWVHSHESLLFICCLAVITFSQLFLCGFLHNVMHDWGFQSCFCKGKSATHRNIGRGSLFNLNNKNNQIPDGNGKCKIAHKYKPVMPERRVIPGVERYRTGPEDKG